MKRLYIAAALLLVVVAVAYIKSARGTSQRREAFENGKAQATEELTTIQQDVDSLKELLRLQEESFADSLAQRDGLYREEISRLVGYLDSAIAQPKPKPAAPKRQTTAQRPESNPKPEVIQKKLEEKTAATENTGDAIDPESAKPEPSVEIAKPSETAELDSDLREDVLTYYGKLYEDLPKDLTSQERKVALYEISIKTAAEYSITMPQLKVICENYYLSY